MILYLDIIVIDNSCWSFSLVSSMVRTNLINWVDAGPIPVQTIFIFLNIKN